jgi:hypothetical protein
MPAAGLAPDVEHAIADLGRGHTLTANHVDEEVAVERGEERSVVRELR